MTPERRQRIAELFEVTLERPAEGRAPFLVEACDGDKALSAEVESLLSEHERAGRFIQRPVLNSSISTLGPVVAASTFSEKAVSEWGQNWGTPS